MRFLKTLTLNRRSIYDSRVALNTDNTFTVADSNAMVLPKSDGSLSTLQTEGMIRYNTTLDEIEVYSGTTATWRTLRYKESTKIIQQDVDEIDGYSHYYGPLNISYNPQNVSSENDNFDGQNILVLVENLLQIWNTNYTIAQNPNIALTTDAQSNAGTNTLSFTSTVDIPKGSVVSGTFIPVGTIATVTDGTTITLSQNITGGNVTAGALITFTSAAGYYLKFPSDLHYASLVGKRITVLHGFDR